MEERQDDLIVYTMLVSTVIYAGIAMALAIIGAVLLYMPMQYIAVGLIIASGACAIFAQCSSTKWRSIDTTPMWSVVVMFLLAIPIRFITWIFAVSIGGIVKLLGGNYNE